MKNLTFKLKTKAWPVVVVDEKEQELKFELRELKAAARDRYVDQLSARLLTDKAGNVIGIKKYDGMQADLLSICMHGEDGNLVPRTTLSSWPGNVVKALFEAAQVLNQFRKSDDRNRVVSEQILKWLSEKNDDLKGALAVAEVTAEGIEEVIENTEKRLFVDAKDRPEIDE